MIASRAYFQHEPLRQVNGGTMASGDSKGYQQGFYSVRVFTQIDLLPIISNKMNPKVQILDSPLSRT